MDIPRILGKVMDISQAGGFTVMLMHNIRTILFKIFVNMIAKGITKLFFGQKRCDTCW